ncbi:MAG: amidohydrolase family protein, partial [Clostridiaceae bacterium]|nr:amidohydrolase family protein [Clostridiaceae bacterium]
MKAFYLKNGLVYQEGRWTPLSVTVDQGIIQALGQANEMGLDEVDAGGGFILPGFIDPHCHGGQGIDCNRAFSQDFLDLSLQLAKKGVTAWLASLAPVSREGTLRALEQAAQAVESKGPGAQLLGIHLEGPFLSPHYRASLDASFIKPVDLDLLDLYMKASRGHIRSMTLALLVILGGVGFPVYRDLKDKRRWRDLRLHSKIVLSLTALLLVLGTLGFQV